jgi:soluble lytic murein transglycosylase-like protein
MKLTRLLFLTCLTAAAAELVVLRSGATIRADRVERAGERAILHAGGGRIELSASQIESVEPVLEAPEASVPSTPEPEPVSVRPVRSVREVVDEAAARHGLPAPFVRAVASAESAFRPDAVSHKGAIGVMQLMPSTAQRLDADPYDIEQNVDAGTRHLRALLLKYQNDPHPVRRALSAYNAGEGAVERYGGTPPNRETQVYVERVLARYWKEIRAARLE